MIFLIADIILQKCGSGKEHKRGSGKVRKLTEEKNDQKDNSPVRGGFLGAFLLTSPLPRYFVPKRNEC
jgi:hypothetical protein